MDKLIAFHERKYVRGKRKLKEVDSRFWFDARTEYKDEDRMYFGRLVSFDTLLEEDPEFLIPPDISTVKGEVIWHYPKIESQWKKT